VQDYTLILQGIESKAWCFPSLDTE